MTSDSRLLGRATWEGADLMPTFRFASHPDDEQPDTTVRLLVVTLPREVAPGDSRVQSRWTGVPRCRGRSPAPASAATTTSSPIGFPKLGVFEDGGWNCHQYHSATEYYSDYGSLRRFVSTLPSNFVVGATGLRTEAPRPTATARRPSLSPGGRSRLHLDGEPGLPGRARSASRTRGCHRSTCGC